MGETKLYTLSPVFWSGSILILASFAFLLSDWTILYSSFGDFILALGIFMMICLGKVQITKKQSILLAIIIGIVLMTSLLSYFFNDYWFNLGRAFLAFVKIVFYLTALVFYYNFVRTNKLEGLFLKISNVFAMFAIIAGIIITVLIYLEMEDIYHTIWTFTRIDNMSYYFIGNENIVRARSLFSEPAHLGYYLNTIFFANLFSEKKSSVFLLIFLAFGILITLSYSMIFIFLITLISFLSWKIVKGEFQWSHWYWLVLILIGTVTYNFWDYLYITIFQRTLNILAGKDGSAYSRLIESWIYVEKERMLYGNGIGHTPPVTNIYAYALSEFGLIGFIPYIVFSLSFLLQHISIFVFFVAMNFAKGGYLNPAFWLFLLYIFLYGISNNTTK